MVRKDRMLTAAVCASALGSVLLLSAPARAAQSSSSDSGGLEEVVVTAQYRKENLQNTALAITAVSGEMLQDQGIKNVQDLGLVVPNASIRPQGSFSGPTAQVGMRGVQTSEFIYTTDPGVGLYIDDVYFGSLTGGAIDLLDLERVEVLRGPQGTLFGKNSLGGAIRLIPKTAKGDDTGTIEATYGTSNRLDLKGSYDFAMTDKLFVRVTGMSKRIDGYQDVLDFPCQMKKLGTPGYSGTLPSLVPTNREQAGNCKIAERGGSQTDGGRVVLRYLASEKLELSIAGDYTSGYADGQPDSKLTRHQASNFFNNLYSEGTIFPKFGVYFTRDDRFVTGNPFTTYAYPVDPVGGKAFPPGQYSKAWGGVGKANYKFSDTLRLDLILGYRGYQIDWMGDGDQMPIDLNHTYELQGHEQTTYEARLSGEAFDKKLEWTGGAYRYEDKSVLGGYVTLPAFAFILPNFNENDHFTTESNSAFLHGGYHFTDALSVNAGVRYTDEKKTYAFDHSPYFPKPGAPSLPPLNYGSSHVDWKLSGDYRFNPEVMVYAQAATGFRSDGSQPRPFTPGQQQEKVPAEKLISYEIGIKTDLLDRRLRMNLAVFQDDYDPRVVLSPGTQCNFPSNLDPGPVFRGLTGSTCPAGTEVGDSASKTGSPWFAYGSAPGKDRGAELEVTATPIDNLSINATLAWFDFVSGAPKTLNGSPNNVYVDPSFKVQAPISGSVGVQYRAQAFNGTLTPRLDVFYQGYRSNGISYLPQLSGSDNKVPGYGLVNFRLTYAPMDGKWDLSLQAENLLDKFYWYQLGAARSTLDGSAADNRTGSPGRPREVSVTFKRNFR